MYTYWDKYSAYISYHIVPIFQFFNTTPDIWSKTIGHNPYKNDEDDVMTKADSSSSSEHAAGLMLLARMTNVSGSEARGGCPKCGTFGFDSQLPC